jgi:hypothetical protein
MAAQAVHCYAEEKTMPQTPSQPPAPNTHFVLREDGVDLVFLGEDKQNNRSVQYNWQGVVELRDMLDQMIKDKTGK